MTPSNPVFLREVMEQGWYGMICVTNGRTGINNLCKARYQYQCDGENTEGRAVIEGQIIKTRDLKVTQANREQKEVKKYNQTT